MPTGSTDRSGDPVDPIVSAAGRAEALLRRAQALTSRSQRRRQRRLAALIEDPAAKRFAFTLTDRVVRPADPRVGARQLRALVEAGVPESLGRFDRLGLRLVARVSRPCPRLVMAVVRRRIRFESAPLILDDERSAIARHLRRRTGDGTRVNLNLLGEAVLGDAEASRRHRDIVDRLAGRAADGAAEAGEIDYVSVKLSAIVANLSVLAFDDSVHRAVERLRPLYRAAMSRQPPGFVNLDMEEYRDLWLTVAAFEQTLDEAEFRDLEAGIVLQAYLPDSSAALRHLTSWAQARVAGHGAPIKVRLVKGANLAAERVEAELHGWPQAPFATKEEVDAHYKALLEWAVVPAHAVAVRVGVASHNVYDLAWAMTRAEQEGVVDRVDLEMLEGMAPGQTAALTGGPHQLVLYTPVTARRDFNSAVAYLTRRLDENTSPQNFLAIVHRLDRDPDLTAGQRLRFVESVRARDTVDTHPRRDQDRSSSPMRFAGEFVNESDTDFALERNRRWANAALQSHRPGPLPAVVAGTTTIDDAVAAAKAAGERWAARPAVERRDVLRAVADELGARRGEALAAMAAEAGKVVPEGDPEVSEAIDFARYYAEAVDTIEELRADGLRFDPPGVVLVAPPWNFPYAIPAGGVLAALAAGSAAILKPAPQTPAVAYELATAMWRAGVPDDLVTYLRCPDGDLGRHLVSHRDVDAVILTGAWETAQLFGRWRGGRRVYAETSGKNAVVVSATADVDLAVRDIVRSAFGHAGQKCSAASLAIVERSVVEDGPFLRQLADAVSSLIVGPATDPASMVGPLIEAPRTGTALHRALHQLDPGESWLVPPECRSSDGRLWRPGVRLGVQPGSWFHHTECFGPVLGVIVAGSVEEATQWQNAVAYGLTGGLHSLDDAEIARWLDRVQVGNAYVNRSTTGAIVRRQPFGGWKRSAVGPGAKAGGPNYVLNLGRWSAGAEPADPSADRLIGARRSFEDAWETHFGRDHDPSGLAAERNVFRYRPLAGPVLLRWDGRASWSDVELALEAAEVAGAQVELSAGHDPVLDAAHRHRSLISTTVEDERAAALRVSSRPGGFGRIRVLGEVSPVLRDAAMAAEIALVEEPVVGHGRIELMRWVREQSVSETRHRYGNLLE